MKLLIVTCVSDRSELALIRGLHQRGADVHVVCDPQETQQEALQDDGIRVTELHVKHRFHWRSIVEIRSLIAREEIDVVYCTSNAGLSCSLFASIGLPVAVFGYRGTLGHLSYFDPSSWFSHLHPSLSGIICNCEAVKEYLLGLGLRESKLHVVYKGHRPEWYKVRKEADILELGLPPGAFVVGCVANIRPIKGVDVLARAVAKLKHLKNLHVVAVGEDRHPGLQELVRELNIGSRFHFTGFREDAREILAACDLSVMPSTGREGVPRAVVESLFVGVPVIVSRVGGLPELVKDGENGYTVPPNDHDALAQKIEALYHQSEERTELAAATRESITEMVDLDRYVERMEDAFRSALSQPSSAIRSAV